MEGIYSQAAESRLEVIKNFRAHPILELGIEVMRTVRTIGSCFFVAYFAFCQGALRTQAGLIYDTPDSVYQQNFDSLPRTGTTNAWTNDSTLPGWYSFSGPTNAAVNSINVSAGGTVTGSPTLPIAGLLSNGGFGSTDRALGLLAATLSPNLANGDFTIAVSFKNAAANPLDSFTVTFDGEQWRRGSNTNSQTLVFSYGFGNTFGSVSWEGVSSLDFTSPVTGATGSALNGNLPANRSADITGTVTGVNWAVNDTLWLRWVDANDIGDEHGLAIDNFRFSASSNIASVPEPSSLLLFAVAGIGGLAFRRIHRKPSDE